MQLFLNEKGERVRIVNGQKQIDITEEQFLVLEPEYPLLSVGQVVRSWTPSLSYIETSDSQYISDTIDPSVYVSNIESYIDAPSNNIVYAHVGLSKGALCIHKDPVDYIIFSAELKPTLDPLSPTLPVTDTWYIRLRHENGFAFDSFEANFVNGALSKQYTYETGLPLGVWYLDENDFIPIDVGGVVYVVKLASPVIFTVYRELL